MKTTTTLLGMVVKVLAKVATATHDYRHPIRYKLRECGLEAFPPAYYGRAK